jgi:hypothetical protein
LRPDWPALKADSVAQARSLVAEVTRLLTEELRRTQAVAHVVEHVATVVAATRQTRRAAARRPASTYRPS